MRKYYILSWLLIFVLPLLGQFPVDSVWTTAKIAAMEAKRWRPNLFKNNAVYNGQNYDWKYAACYWEINPEVKYISGRVVQTIDIIIPTDTIRFDMSADLHVNSVLADGIPVQFVFTNNFTLAVILPQDATPGIKEIEINYEGEPISHSALSFVQSFHGTEPEIYTLSEPFGARDWWPCKQTLNDKLDSIFIQITVPVGIKAGSNGSLEYVTENGDGSQSFGWKHRFPIPAYLVSIAATNYASYTQSTTVEGKEIQVLNYVYPERLALAQSRTLVVPDLLNLFSTYFGIYPYWPEKYGHCQTSIPGGMEHTTMSTMAGFYYSLVAHEMAHQWFGDKVTCGSWAHIWLNEGFATFLTGLSYEALFDQNRYMDWKLALQQSIKSQPGGSVYVADSTSRVSIFNGRLSYNKGAYLLIMLREIMGDDLFFQACREYLNDPDLAFGYAVTSDFKAHLESVAQRDFTQFFDHWFYGEGYPIYDLTWSPTADGILITLLQTTSDPSVDFYALPLPIQLIGDTQSKIVKLDNSFSGQQFYIPSSFDVREVKIDPYLNILADRSVSYSPTSDVDVNKIQISPNPATNSIQFSILNPAFNAAKVEIFDVLGRLIFSQNPTGGIHGSRRIDISNLRYGTYILRLSNGSSERTASFVVAGG